MKREFEDLMVALVKPLAAMYGIPVNEQDIRDEVRANLRDSIRAGKSPCNISKG